tara:strand:- start:1451 stop:1567 length:117 start_codon:yes stop_codon:yes gene_type:complete
MNMERIKFGIILVACEVPKKEVTWIDDCNYFCEICAGE